MDGRWLRSLTGIRVCRVDDTCTYCQPQLVQDPRETALNFSIRSALFKYKCNLFYMCNLLCTPLISVSCFCRRAVGLDHFSRTAVLSVVAESTIDRSPRATNLKTDYTRQYGI